MAGDQNTPPLQELPIDSKGAYPTKATALVLKGGVPVKIYCPGLLGNDISCRGHSRKTQIDACAHVSRTVRDPLSMQNRCKSSLGDVDEAGSYWMFNILSCHHEVA